MQQRKNQLGEPLAPGPRAELEVEILNLGQIGVSHVLVVIAFEKRLEPGELFAQLHDQRLVALKRGPAPGKAEQHCPDLEHVLDFFDGELGDDRAAPGLDADQTLLL